MRAARLAWIVAGLAVTIACGQVAPPAEPPDKVFRPADKPVGPPDDGRGELSDVVAATREAVYPQGRWIRCAVPDGFPTDGALGAVIVEGETVWLEGADVHDGIFSATVPRVGAIASILMDDVVVARVRWKDAERSQWRACDTTDVPRYELLGSVVDENDRGIAGATVRTCEPGLLTTNDEGRFLYKAPVGHPCPLLAIVEDEAGLGRSPEQIYRSDAPEEDVIASLTVDADRLTSETAASMASRLGGLLELTTRNGVHASVEQLERRIADASLPPEQASVANGWLAASRLRAESARAQVTALGGSPAEGLRALWESEYR